MSPLILDELDAAWPRIERLSGRGHSDQAKDIIRSLYADLVLETETLRAKNERQKQMIDALRADKR